MIGNYLLIALRNLRKHFSYSLINIAGLGLGLATCLLLSVWILHELSYDSFHANYNKLYRVSLEYSFGGQTSKTSVSPTKLLPTLKQEFPEVEDGVRFYNVGSFQPIIVRNGDRVFEENKFYYADSSFFKVFSFRLLEGNPDKALVDPNSIVLTQSSAKRYFGNESALGKPLKIGSKSEYVVTGVVEDPPSNSMITFDMVSSFSTTRWAKELIWWSANFQTYVVLSDKADLALIQDKTNAIVKKELGSEVANPGDYVKYNFMPMKDIYLRSDIEEPEVTGSIQYVYIFSAIAALILLIACINYINLATARAADRAKEVGVRKVVGAVRKQLITQFMGESVVITIVAFVLSLLLASIVLPLFNNLTGKLFTLGSIMNPMFLVSSILVICAIALGAGLYPAAVITGFKPVNILKGNFKTSNRGIWLRKSLVVFQFSISIMLIIGTVVIMKQMKFVQEKKLGYDRENVIMIPYDGKTAEAYSQLKTELLRSGKVLKVARASESPVRIQAGYSIQSGTTSDRGIMTVAMPIDEDFIPTMNMEIIAGRNLSEADMTAMRKDTVYSFILNEAAIKEMYLDLDKAVGHPVSMGDRRKGVITGVVKDFHFASMHESIRPLVLFTQDFDVNHVFMRLAPGDPTQALEEIKTITTGLLPHRPFEYKFLNERYNALYEAETRMGTVSTVFSIIAILIACLGLLGLVSFAAAQKTKEIGIRKVLGASAPGIVFLITKDFTVLVLIAIAIGIPLSWYVMEQYWLTNFAYHTTIGVWPFVFAAIGCIAVAFATASYQAIKASLINPANTLRNE